MKKLIFVVIAVVLTVGMLAISGCGKKKQPEVQTVGVSDITSSSAKLNAVIINDGNDRIVSSGFYYSTDQGMSNKQTVQNSGYGSSESFSVYLSNLQASTTYYYQAFAINGKGTGIGEVMSFTTSAATSGGSSGGSQGGGTPTPSPTPTPGQLNGHAYVDLGLPSGTLWATCNVGAETPEGYGNYYAWGETTTKENYRWSTYRWCNGSYTTLTKYCNDANYGNNGFTDALTTLETTDDAATANWGTGWRMPTMEEMNELKNNCTQEWTTQNGVNGRLFTGHNGNSIFLPAAGCHNERGFYDAGYSGYYWSSSLGLSESYDAHDLFFYSDNWYDGNRCYGFSVRPVCSSNTSTVQSNTVTFNANGGTGYMQPQTFRQGVSQALSANSFYRDGYTFSGWNTVANGNGVSYSNRQTITINSNITLYAQWTANVGSQGSGQLNGHAYVDLGLPSGTKWATCNIGATVPEGYGNYYAWGETSTKEIYNYSTYRYCNGDERSFTKYCYNTIFGYNGYTDNLTTLEASDDAATVNWGVGWRIPTETELIELHDNCTHIWTTQNGVNGRLFTGTNGNSIFLPAAGYRKDGSLYGADVEGLYWSNLIFTGGTPDIGLNLEFNSNQCLGHGHNRFIGTSVRAVCNQ